MLPINSESTTCQSIAVAVSFIILSPLSLSNICMYSRTAQTTTVLPRWAMVRLSASQPPAGHLL